jgi:hypothetical protein
MIMQLASAIIAMADLFKMGKQLIQEITKQVIQRQIDSARDSAQDIEESRAILISKMQKAKNDKERIALSIAISAISNGK